MCSITSDCWFTLLGKALINTHSLRVIWQNLNITSLIVSNDVAHRREGETATRLLQKKWLLQKSKALTETPRPHGLSKADRGRSASAMGRGRRRLLTASKVRWAGLFGPSLQGNLTRCSLSLLAWKPQRLSLRSQRPIPLEFWRGWSLLSGTDAFYLFCLFR